jgi:hypothetical protein
MPKTKKNNDTIEKMDPKKVVEKIDDEETLDPELVLAEGEEGAEEDEEMLDDDVDPFHDKWEE